MTTAIPPHVRSGAPARGWRVFRRWRRSRPFWGGLLTVLAGLEIFATTQASLSGLTFQMGPTGFLSWLIPTILVACGLLMWFTPQQRMFYAVVGAMTAVFSLIGVNLGGFLVGLLLGIIGSSLGFAWVPLPTAAPADADAPDGAAAGDAPGTAAGDARRDRDGPGGHPVTTFDDLLGGPSTDLLRTPHDTAVDARAGHSTVHRSVMDDPADDDSRAGGPAGAGHHWSDEPTADRPVVTPATLRPAPPPVGGAPATPTTGAAVRGTDDTAPGHGGGPGRNPRLLAVTLVMLSLSTIALATVRGATPASAEPCEPTSRPTASTPSGTGLPRADRAAPSATPDATAAAAPAPAGGERDGGLIGDLIDGVRDLFGAGDERQRPEAAAPVEPTPGTSAPAGARRLPTAAVSSPATRCADPSATPSAEPSAPTRLKKLRVAADQPAVAGVARLTGSKVTMYGLRIDGVVDLPTKTGTIKVLRFSMRKAVIDRFELRSPGAAGATGLTTSRKLTVEGDVHFYASRFEGRILGIKLTLTPNSPLIPGGIPLTLPVISFTSPKIDLVFVECEKLTAGDMEQEVV